MYRYKKNDDLYIKIIQDLRILFMYISNCVSSLTLTFTFRPPFGNGMNPLIPQQSYGLNSTTSMALALNKETKPYTSCTHGNFTGCMLKL